MRTAAMFVNKYSPYIFRANEGQLYAIAAEQVKWACLACAHSAAGPDAWEPAEMAILSDDAYQLIARLLKCI